MAVQDAASAPSEMTKCNEDGLWKDARGKIWIPDDATDLQVRICVVGHFGIAGHRGMTLTLQQISERFVWADMKSDVEFFVQRCLHCASTLSGQRQLEEALHTDHLNELIHWDFLFMEESDTKQE
ncbi:hypothetical protein PHYSODRAFT_304447 [Phytophthora sojae]|uniref:Integrase zinc-binding domain-containing protein n=1 Tax=Phytophthora sojae (strain P6497) TaxID=1094619 RepID=G5A130_PHYSP|nr:hypothetical protein PHYSODRAFT_304447 [Phytophthora sojae]EGZ10632.1 hypothetical protein PHYSODRAFT_304447 [Phytophthora sojae]|eukprot:XP_009533377.1 hypothetical protein PHYSODRAFT_304447 [Phytophthora sojae]